jgi:alkylated DNA repair protein (DNA oxidative demethylase)
MDADLQDPPEVVLEMIAKWKEGYDVVSAERASRQVRARHVRMDRVPPGNGDLRPPAARRGDARRAVCWYNRIGLLFVTRVMPLAAIAIAPGVSHFPDFLDRAAQAALRDEVLAILSVAPLFRPRMPRTGKPFSVRMSNCGPLGWVSDQAGYRYQPAHPDTGRPWPAMPPTLLAAFATIAPSAPPPEACLINVYDAAARMGLHRDRDEEELTAPVVSLSLGDTALFRVGGLQRNAPTRSFRLASGDAMSLAGEGRLAFHGVDRIIAGSSTLLPQGGRINLTLRRVTRAKPQLWSTISS